MTGVLQAVTRDGVTAGEALTWWRSEPTSPMAVTVAPVGFGVSTRAASWWRLDDHLPCGPDNEPLPLDEVYELVGFDGDRELRWLHEADGRGRAVVLAEHGVALPDGVDVSDPRKPRPLEDDQLRLLAGRVSRTANPDWLRIVEARYKPADLPLRLNDDVNLVGSGADTPVVVLEAREYAVEDEHGNLTVIDTRRIRLDIRTRKQLHLDLTGKD